MKAIITYHSIDDSDSVISIDQDTFRRHVEWLCAAEVPLRSLSDLLRSECTEGISMTFDDGFENFATGAWPVLRAHDVPATVFVVSDRVGQENDWGPQDGPIPRLRLMDWSTLGGLVSEGVILGAHSGTHPDLRTLAGDPLRSEIEVCRDAIARETGMAPTSFAYPYGHYSVGTVKAVADAGYTIGVTTEMALLDSAPTSPLELPRLDAFYFKQPETLQGWGTERFRRFVSFRAGARRVRTLLARTGLPL